VSDLHWSWRQYLAPHTKPASKIPHIQTKKTGIILSSRPPAFLTDEEAAIAVRRDRGAANLPQCWSRNWVGLEAGVEIKDNSWLTRFINLLRWNARWKSAVSRTGHFEIEALRVVLRATYLAGVVQCDNLAPKHIVSALERRRYLDLPCIVVFGEVIRGKNILCSGCYESRLGNFGPAERRNGSGKTVVIGTGCQIINHGPVVRFCPWRPLKLDKSSQLPASKSRSSPFSQCMLPATYRY
jgi:hypothetical protein